MLDLVALRSFVHVCEVGTVAGAAAGLGYTAPAVSQHVAKLERELGVALFDRAGGRLRPTAEGVALGELAGSMLDLAEQARHLAPLAGRPEPLHVVAFGSAVAELVAPALAGLAGADVVVRGMDDDGALRALRLGHADLAIVQEYDHQPLGRDARLRYTELTRDALRLVLPPQWPARASLRDLDGAPWLLNGEGSHCSSAVLRILAVAGIAPRITASVDDNQALLRLVAAGHGACIVPALVLASGASGVTISGARLGASRAVHAVVRRSSGTRADAFVAALAAVSPRGRRG